MTVTFLKYRTYAGELGPGWLAAAIAAGPGTMASVMSAGAAFGFQYLWVVMLSAVCATVAQLLAVRLSLHQEQGIVSHVRQALGKPWARLLVFDTVIAAGLAQLVIMRALAGATELITGVDQRLWAPLWALLIAFALLQGGYKFAERVSKVLVGLMVLAFILTLGVVDVPAAALAKGLLPTLPLTPSGVLLAGGILGGAVHVTLLSMQSYTMRARGWGVAQRGIAHVDTLGSMLLAFGVYSVSIFLVAAATLYPAGQGAEALSAVTGAQALAPLVGRYAESLFLAGLLGAALSTLVGNSVVPAYLIADHCGWDYLRPDKKFKAAVAAFALLSALGVFLGAAFFKLLVVMLAFSLPGTAFALLLILILLNQEGQRPLPRWLNTAGCGLLLLMVGLAAAFVESKWATALSNPLDAFAVGFGLLMALACVWLLLSKGKKAGGRA